jgi:hypothetical protein
VRRSPRGRLRVLDLPSLGVPALNLAAQTASEPGLRLQNHSALLSQGVRDRRPGGVAAGDDDLPEQTTVPSMDPESLHKLVRRQDALLDQDLTQKPTT